MKTQWMKVMDEGSLTFLKAVKVNACWETNSVSDCWLKHSVEDALVGRKKKKSPQRSSAGPLTDLEAWVSWLCLKLYVL